MKLKSFALAVTLTLVAWSPAYAGGECASYKKFIASQIGEGSWTYKTNEIRNQEFPETKCQIEVKTQLVDTISVGTYLANGYTGCQAVYQVTDTDTGSNYTMKSTPFAVVVSDSGRPLDALFAQTPSDDLRSMMSGQYQPQPFTIRLHNEGVSELGRNQNCYVDFNPIKSIKAPVVKKPVAKASTPALRESNAPQVEQKIVEQQLAQQKLELERKMLAEEKTKLEQQKLEFEQQKANQEKLKSQNPTTTVNPSENSAKNDQSAQVANQSIDKKYHDLRAKCERGFAGLMCRESLKSELCEGKWQENPPEGSGVCKRAAQPASGSTLLGH